jgi:polyferredoxin
VVIIVSNKKTLQNGIFLFQLIYVNSLLWSSNRSHIDLTSHFDSLTHALTSSFLHHGTAADDYFFAPLTAGLVSHLAVDSVSNLFKRRKNINKARQGYNFFLFLLFSQFVCGWIYVLGTAHIICYEMKRKLRGRESNITSVFEITTRSSFMNAARIKTFKTIVIR